MNIYNCFRIDQTNVGDWHSPPFRYFKELGDLQIESVSDDMPKEKAIVVIGGGGLISPKKGFMKIKRFLKNHICIGWGLGENWIDKKDHGYCSYQKSTFPKWLSGFSALGLRDHESNFFYVPCASCMHQVFDDYASCSIKRTVGFYLHKRIPLATYGNEFITNDGSDIEEKIRFLGESEVVVTNSYHGVYWAMLLNKKIICVPFGTKFFNFKEKLYFTSPWNLKLNEELFQSLPSYGGFLKQARRQNLEFWKLLRSKLQI